MKTTMKLILTAATALTALVTCATAQETDDYEIVDAAMGAGGGAASSSHYSNFGAVGGWGGGKATATAKDGTEISSEGGGFGPVEESEGILLVATANPESIGEGQLGQLEASLIMADHSVVALDPSKVSWSILSGPIVSVAPEGVVLAGSVYQDEQAVLRGTYDGLTDDFRLRVVNTTSDDYGAYAYDGLPDDWQVHHFGEASDDAGPMDDPDGDRQTNEQELNYGTDPTDPNSKFRLRVEAVPGEAHVMNVVFSPVFGDRKYAVEAQTPLGVGDFQELQKTKESDGGLERTVTDLEGIASKKFYRVRVELP